MAKPKKPFVARVYLGHGRYRWVGRYATRKERDRAKAKALLELGNEPPAAAMTVGAYADRFLRDYEKTRKDSSVDTARSNLKPFLRDFGGRDLRSISRVEAKDWAHTAKPHWVPVVVTLMNQAVDDDLIDKNPFRGLGRRTEGRSNQRPPTRDEFEKLSQACDVLGKYGPRMRALLWFAAYSGMRPGELYALEWADVDMDRMRIRVTRRLYRGRLDVPKGPRGNPGKEIALTPPARDALLTLPRDRRLVFLTKTGRRLSQAVMSGYWAQVQAAAGLSFDFYLATKHFCVHYMHVELGLPDRAVAAQMGWKQGEAGRSIRKLLGVYAHAEVGALDAVDRAFETADVRPLRPVRDATPDATGRDPA